MSSIPPLPPIACTHEPCASVPVDLLVIPWFEGERTGTVAELGAVGATAEISRALAAGEFLGKPFDTFVTGVTEVGWIAKRVMLVGAGPADRFDTDTARRVAATAALSARQRRIGRVGLVLRCGRGSAAGDVDVAGHAQAVAEGLTLGEFVVGRYKSDDPTPPVPAWTIVIPDVPDTSPESQARIDAFVTRGRILGQASNLARELANEPGNVLTPRLFAERAAAIASAAGVSVEVLDEHQKIGRAHV